MPSRLQPFRDGQWPMGVLNLIVLSSVTLSYKARGEEGGGGGGL